MLTDAACRKAVPGEKERKLFDERGLYLRITPAGSKSWCMKYRFGSKEKKLTLGSYPEISLARARALRDEARRELAVDKDPALERKKRKAVAVLESLDTFEKIARAWHEQKAKTLNDRYATQILDRLRENVFPTIGAMPIRQITPPMLLEVVRGVERRGAIEMAHRVRLHMSDVFVWAISSGIAENDPAAVIRKAIQPTDPKLRPALLKPAEVRSILPATEAQGDPYWATLLSSRLLALTAARPGVVRLAERGEFEDLESDAPIWRIPAAKMKLTRKKKRDTTYEFLIPLSVEAVETVKTAMLASPSPNLLFPGVGDRRKPISDSTLSKHYRQANLQGRHVPHGWRASFSTVMNERAAIAGNASDREIIDLMLAHMQEGVEPIYNRAAYMPRRREIAQEWAVFLMAGLPPARSLLPPIFD